MSAIANLVRTFSLPPGVSSFSDLMVRVRAENNNNPVRIYDKNSVLMDANGMTYLDSRGTIDVWVLQGFDYIVDLVNARDTSFVYESRRNMAGGQPNDDQAALPRSATINPPLPFERIVLFKNTKAKNISMVSAVLPGAYDNPSLAFNIGYGPNVAAAGNSVWNSDIVLTNTTTGIDIDSFDNGLIPENVWVWLAINALQGTIPSLQVTIKE